MTKEPWEEEAKNTFEFRECDTCAAKPGASALCKGCLLNRYTIECAIPAIRHQRQLARIEALREVSKEVENLPDGYPEPGFELDSHELCIPKIGVISILSEAANKLLGE